MNDAQVYEMQCNYGSQTPEVLQTLVKNILKYLRRTKDVFLVYGGEEELVVNGYIDASFQTDTNDSQSQSGFVFHNKWWCYKLKKFQVGDSDRFYSKVKYIAASGAAKEGVWMRRFLIELGVFPDASSPLNLHCDNNGAMAQAKESRNH
jgi:hypothetical protein